MTEIKAQGSRGSPADRPRFSRLLVAPLAVITAAIVVLSLSVGSAGAHHDEVVGVHHEPETRDHHEDCEHHGGKFGHRVAVKAVAELLDVDAETLRDRMKDGDTLADIAASEGVEVSDVIDAIVAAIVDHAAEHDHEVNTEALIERVTALVNGERPERPDGSSGWHERRGPHRLGGHIGSHSAGGTT